MIFTVNETLRFPPQSPRIAWNVGKKAAEALEQANARNLNAMTSWLTKLRRRNLGLERAYVLCFLGAEGGLHRTAAYCMRTERQKRGQDASAQSRQATMSVTDCPNHWNHEHAHDT